MFGAFQLLFFGGVLTALGVLGAPLGQYLVPDARDGGRGAGRVAALGLWMYLFWIVPLLTPLSPTPSWAVFSLSLVAALCLRLRRKEWWLRRKSTLRHEWTESALFLSLFLLFAWIRSWAGDIYETEKFMDAMILRALMVTDTFPPQDRWMSGWTVNYHYLGHLLFLPLIKIAALKIEYAYNLIVASILPLVFGLLFSWMSRFFSSFRSLLIFSLGAVFLSNLSTVAQLLGTEGFFSWWNTSRVIPFTINEYPIFSFFVGDVHAHYVSYPVTILSVLALLRWLHAPKTPLRTLDVGLVGALVGMHYGLNAWALPPLLFLAALMILIRSIQNQIWMPGWKKSVRVFGAFLGGLFVAALPFAWFYEAPPTALGWLSPEWRSPLKPYLVFWGALLLPVFFGAVREFMQASRRYQYVVAGISILSIIFLGGAVGFLLFLLGGSLWRWRERILDPTLSPVLVMAALVILLGCEFLSIRETYAFSEPWPRSNTVFKYFYISWAFLLLAMPGLWKELPRAGRFLSVGIWVLCLIFVPITLLSRTVTPISTLDGLKWLKVEHREEWAAIQWMEKNTTPKIRIVEGVAPSLHGFSPVSTFSGRPTVIAWFRHEGIWRPRHGPEMVQRVQDVKELYQTTDTNRVLEILQKYGAEYVIFGLKERKLYGKDAGAGLQNLQTVFQAGPLQIYDRTRISEL